MTPAEIHDVPSAAKFLDEKIPGWAAKVVKPVHMPLPSKCILGQVDGNHGGYSRLLDKLFNGNPPWGCGASLFSNSIFNEEWQAEVNKRKNVGESFEWAIQQLRAGRDVQLEPGVTFRATGNIDGYFFTYSQIHSQNWKLAPLKFHDLVRGDRFIFVSDKPGVSVHTKCNERYYVTLEHFVCEHVGNQVVERA